MPATRTPRELLLASLERRGLTAYRVSPDAAWAVFTPAFAGGSVVEVVHLPRARRYRVTSTRVLGTPGRGAVQLGTFRTSDEAVACAAEALAHDIPARRGG